MKKKKGNGEGWIRYEALLYVGLAMSLNIALLGCGSQEWTLSRMRSSNGEVGARRIGKSGHIRIRQHSP